MKRSLLEFLQDILVAIAEIESFVEGVDFDGFVVSREKLLAVIKLLEIIGEAVKQIPKDRRALYPDIPWKAIAGSRDIFVHQYWDIDMSVVWSTVQVALPLLKPVVVQMIQQEERILLEDV